MQVCKHASIQQRRLHMSFLDIGALTIALALGLAIYMAYFEKR